MGESEKGAASAAPASGEQTAALAMWEFPGSPWVVATSREAAMAALRDERLGVGDLYDGELVSIRRMPDDEPFTMNYEEPGDIPAGLERDVNRPCPGCGAHNDDDECVTVTISCAEWCAVLHDGAVVREFQS